MSRKIPHSQKSPKCSKWVSWGWFSRWFKKPIEIRFRRDSRLNGVFNQGYHPIVVFCFDYDFWVRVITVIRYLMLFELGYTPWCSSGHAGHNSAPLVLPFHILKIPKPIISWFVFSEFCSEWNWHSLRCRTTVTTLIHFISFSTHGCYPNRFDICFAARSLP